MHRALAASVLAFATALASRAQCEPPRRAGTPSGVAAAAAAKYPCGESTCDSAKIVEPLRYSREVAATGYFNADFVIEHHCSCTRHMSLLVAFTLAGTNSTKEHTFKVDVVPGKSTSSVVISNAELAAAKITPGRYNLTFALYDEHERPLGASLTGNAFTFGSSKESLPSKPQLSDAIAAKDDLPVTFAFSNDGDATARVTALVVFTRPGSETSIEHYEPNLIVPPGGAKHVVRVTAAQRRKLGVGAGPWLIGTSAFDAAGGRMASYPGHPLAIGKVLSLPSAPELSTPIHDGQDLSVKVTFKNESEIENAVTALLVFARAGDAKSIEYERELRVAPGSSTHSIVLGPGDRERLGISPGRWRVSVSGFDAAGKRLDTQRGRDLVITAARASR